MKKKVALFLSKRELSGDKLMGITMLKNPKKLKEPGLPHLFLIRRALKKMIYGSWHTGREWQGAI